MNIQGFFICLYPILDFKGVFCDKVIKVLDEKEIVVLAAFNAACMSYGDKLSGIIKSKLSDRAKESWNLAIMITKYMGKTLYVDVWTVCNMAVLIL